MNDPPGSYGLLFGSDKGAARFSFPVNRRGAITVLNYRISSENYIMVLLFMTLQYDQVRSCSHHFPSHGGRNLKTSQPAGPAGTFCVQTAQSSRVVVGAGRRSDRTWGCGRNSFMISVLHTKSRPLHHKNTIELTNL